MSEITVEAACGTTKDFDTRSEAENGIDTHLALCEDCSEDDIVAYTGDRPDDLHGDGGPEVVDESDPVEPAEHDNRPADPPTEPEDYSSDLPDEGPSVDEDPLVWMPDEFTDTIDGTVAINRKGFEVLAHHYSIQCQTSVVESLCTDERVVFKATATDEDGDVYTAFGSAGEERDDVSRGRPVVEMADTRAYKRAVSRATGVGIVAVDELQGSMEGDA